MVYRVKVQCRHPIQKLLLVTTWPLTPRPSSTWPMKLKMIRWTLPVLVSMAVECGQSWVVACGSDYNQWMNRRRLVGVVVESLVKRSSSNGVVTVWLTELIETQISQVLTLPEIYLESWWSLVLRLRMDNEPYDCRHRMEKFSISDHERSSSECWAFVEETLKRRD